MKKRSNKRAVREDKKTRVGDLGKDEAFEENEDWGIVACCFLVNVMVIGFFKSIGIVMIELENLFSVDPAKVSILVSIMYFLNCTAGPLACYFVTKFSTRSLALAGTLLVSSGLILSWFATSIIHIVGALIGFGSGLTYSPGLILVGSRFWKNRAIANGIVVCGAPVGTMVMPYAINVLIDLTDCRGAFLILGGMMLNAVVCTLSYRPLRTSKYGRSGTINSMPCSKRPIFDNNEHKIGDTLPLSSNLKTESDSSSGPEYEKLGSSALLKLSKSVTSDFKSSKSLIFHKINELMRNYVQKRDSTTSKEIGGAVTKDAETSTHAQAKSMSTKTLLPKIGATGEVSTSDAAENSKALCASDDLLSLVENKKTSKAKHYDSSFRNIIPFKPIVDKEFLPVGAKEDEGRERLRPRRRVESHSSPHHRPSDSLKMKVGSGFQSAHSPSPYILSLDHSCVIICSQESLQANHKTENKPGVDLSAAKQEKKLQTEGKGEGQDGPFSIHSMLSGSRDGPPSQRGYGSCARLVVRKMMAWLQTSPLRNTSYLMLLFSNAAPAIGTTNSLLLIPSLGNYAGLSKKEYTTIYSIISMADMTSRLLGSILSHRNYLSTSIIYALGLFLSGLCNVFFGVCDQYWKFVFVSSMFGMATGLHIGVYGILLGDIVGLEQLHSGYALSMILNGVLQFVGPYICGTFLSKYPGEFWQLFAMFGIILMLGGILWFVSKLSIRKKKNDEEIRTANNRPSRRMNATQEDITSKSTKASGSNYFNPIFSQMTICSQRKIDD